MDALTFSLDVITEVGTPIRVVLNPHSSGGIVSFFDRRLQYSDNGHKICDYFYNEVVSPGFESMILSGGHEDWHIDWDTFNMIFRWLRSFEF